MTVSASNGNSSILEYAKQYEDQLLADEELKKNGGVDLAGLTLPKSAVTLPGDKKSGKDDEKKVGDKKVTGGGSGKDEDLKTTEKKEIVKTTTAKTEENKATEKSDAIKKTYNTDAISRSSKTTGTDATKSIDPALLENVNLSQEEAVKAYETGVKITEAMTYLVGQCGGNFAELSSEDLLAAFMKIQLADPAKNTETLNDLNDCMKSLRKLAHKNEESQIKKQEVEQEEAIKQAKEAKGYASAMKVFKIVLIVVVVVAAIVATAATFGGASAPAALVTAGIIAAVVGGMAGATTAAISAKEAANNLAVAEQSAKATEAQLEAMDFERVKEVFQEMVGDNQELLQALMESFNTFCSLLKTLIDRQASSVKVLSDATIR